MSLELIDHPSRETVLPERGERDPGSFRDPAGFVFHRGGRVYRALRGPGASSLVPFLQSELFTRLTAAGRIAPARIIDDPARRADLAMEFPDGEQFLEHPALWPWTYPCEWTPSMLADAGRLTLELQLELLDGGYGLKDASAYNVQFDRGRPTFIDVASVECPRRRDLWPALGQFQAMFTIPLLFCWQNGWDLRSCFLGSPDGRSMDEAWRRLSPWGRMRPALWADVTLPRLLSGLVSWLGLLSGPELGGESSESNVETVGRRRLGVELRLDPPEKRLPVESQPPSFALRVNLLRLWKKLSLLAERTVRRGVWTDYQRDCHYAPAAMAAKRRFVERAMRRFRPRTVVDLGCNAGAFSRIAAQAGARVLAIDSDPSVVEALYQSLRDEPLSITPCVADIANPTPGFGWAGLERQPLLSRAASDVALALALSHHLLIGENLSWRAIAAQLGSLGRKAFVLEHVPPGDPLIRSMLRFREPPREDLSLSACLSAMGERFKFLERETLPESGRTMLLYQTTP